jgi:hypothetical protein
MIREIDLHNFFVKYLISNGYPENSITIHPILEYLGRKYRPDFVIVDPDSNKPLAIFELKSKRTDQSESSAIQQLVTYAQAIKIPDIPLFAVFPIGLDNKSLEFEFFTISPSTEKKESDRITKHETLPDYKLLKNSRLSEEISKISDEQEQTEDYFQILCWISAIFVCMLLVADYLNIYKIDVQRLGLIGLIVGLFILPYASKLKLLGLEFEKLTLSKKDKDEKK